MTIKNQQITFYNIIFLKFCFESNKDYPLKVI